MKSPLVSIIIPIYNSQLFLRQCIDSVLNQTYRNIEILLINDGSTDDSGNVCDEYALLDSRIAVIHKPNGGLVNARKTGLEHCTGEYVLYIDGDDWIRANLIETYIQCAINENADVVISSYTESLLGKETIAVNPIPIGVYDKQSLYDKVYPRMLCTDKFSQFGIFSYSWGKLYRKSILYNNQMDVPSNTVIGEDALCLYPTLIDANIVVIINEPYYYYRQRTDSLTKQSGVLPIKSVISLYERLCQIFANKGMRDIMEQQLQRYILSLLTVFTDGPIDNQLYPFEDIEPNSALVIYNAGTFGQHLYKRISNAASHRIVGWIDDNAPQYISANLPVSDVDSIELLYYDYILIAFIDETISDLAKAKLIHQGVSESSIRQVSHYNKDIQTLLNQYNINGFGTHI